MRVEILTIGDEILSGDITDTNSAFLSAGLSNLGLQITHHTSVRDDEADMQAAMQTAAERADLVFVSGGLGPTSDDFTLEVAAKVFGVVREFHEPTVQKLTERYQKRGLALSLANKNQALIPVGAVVLNNAVGTAPGVAYHFQQTQFYFLPGVPKELQHIFNTEILPTLKSDTKSVFQTAVLKSYGIAESDMQTRLADLFVDRVYINGVKVAFRVAFPDVYLKLSLHAESLPVVNAKIEAVKKQITQRLHEGIYADDLQTTLEDLVVKKFTQNKMTLAVAESCTGGLIAHRLTNVPGASAVFLAGLTTYANAVKESVLHVPQTVLKQFGAVSAECATAMVQGLKQQTAADVCVATTGIAGPDGGTDDKPVGTVFVAILHGSKLEVQKYFFPFGREMFKQYVASKVLKELSL